jgi:tetratricopeptide (TPR) repeat protein
MHKYFLTMGSFNTSLNDLPKLDVIAEQSFVVDWRMIGKAYRDIFYAEIDSLIETGDWESVVMQGVEAYEQSLKQHPLRAQYWYEYAQTLSLEASVTGDKDGFYRSVDAIERSAELAPQRLDIALAQIQLYVTIGEYEKAQILFERTSQLDECRINQSDEGVLEIQCD